MGGALMFGPMACIEATSLGDAWFQAISTIMRKGRKYLITSGSYEGTHRIGMPITISIIQPGMRPLAPIMPESSNIPPPATEDQICDYLSYLMTPHKSEKEHYTYGQDLSPQVPWVIEYFKKAGHGTNHCYMTVGRPETLLFYDRDVDYNETIVVVDRRTGKRDERIITNQWNKDPLVKTSSQCLRGIDVWIEDGKLHFWIYFRSWDLWGGFPVNLGGLQLVKEFMASEVGVDDGAMIVSCKDLHIYEHAEAVALMRIYETKETVRQ